MLLRSPINGGTIDASDAHAPLLLASGWAPVRAVAHGGPATDLTGMTVAQLRALCAERGIAAPRRATRAQLMLLIEG